MTNLLGGSIIVIELGATNSKPDRRSYFHVGRFEWRKAMYKTTLKINGMMCSMCEAHINDAIRKNFEVKKVSSSHKKGITEIISQQQIPRDQLIQVIAQTGYELGDINTETYLKKGLFGR